MEERLKFLASGTKPRKNKEAMKEVLDELKKEGLYFQNAKTNIDESESESDEEKVVKVSETNGKLKKRD